MPILHGVDLQGLQHVADDAAFVRQIVALCTALAAIPRSKKRATAWLADR